MNHRTGLPVVGVVGGGQLARMMHQAAIGLGQSMRVLALSAADGAALVTADAVVGHHADLEALRRFAKDCDVVTFDHEHVPAGHIRALAADGVVVRPGWQALRHAQDKRVMRERLAKLGVPVPSWRPVTGADDVADLFASTGGPVVAKASTGGYDGRGVWPLSTASDVEPLLARGIPLIVEERVLLRRELAALVARSPWGQVAAYPVVETVQRNGICVEVLAPAPGLDPDVAVAAQQLAIRLATELDVVGVLAVELFELDRPGSGRPGSGRPGSGPPGSGPPGSEQLGGEQLGGEQHRGGLLLVNELAMRPHNSGHWTIEGARTSQFEQHLRAVLDYPLGAPELTAPAAVMANVLGGPDGGMSIDERLHHAFAADPQIRVHLYGKQVRPGRKIGHVTVLGDDVTALRQRAGRAARWLAEGLGD